MDRSVWMERQTDHHLFFLVWQMNNKPVLMRDPRFEEISKRIQETYPNACLLYIDEIINPELLEKFENQKKTIPNARVVQLFHGSTQKNIANICEQGFDPTKNVVAAYGRGTYFARDAQYSWHYMRTHNKNDISYMFLADVIVGRTHVYGSQQTIDTKLHDNSVDRIRDPTIFVTPHHYGAYPRYVIAFHKDAEY